MENKNVPSIRFKGFIDDWEQRKLGEVIINELKGKAKANMDGLKSIYLDAEYLNGGKVCYVDSPTDVSIDDVLILWDGSQAGAVYHGFEGALGSTLKSFKPKYSGDFLYQFLIRNQEKIYNSYRTPNIPHVIKSFTSEFKINNPKEEERRVHGIDGLRVVDASIMPNIITGNLNATTIMLAEKIADKIRGRQPLPKSAADYYVAHGAPVRGEPKRKE